MFSIWPLLLVLSAAQADDTDFLGGEETEENITFDPISRWPSKLIIDSQTRNLLLVWFDKEEPEKLEIPFVNVTKIFCIPASDGIGEELHLEIEGDKRYLVGYSYTGTQQQKLLLSALLQITVKDNDNIAFRIANRDINRTTPNIVVGSINDPNATKPSADVVDDQILHDSAVGETMGEDLPSKSKGSISRKSIGEVIMFHQKRFEACYRRVQDKIPDLKGTVQVDFSINKDGKVAGARITKSSINNAEVERCVLRNLYGLKFSKPQGGTVIVSYPFIFVN